MDKTRFDGLTKSLAGTMDRRGFVRTVLGFGAATAVSAVGVGSVMARSAQDGTVDSPICVRVCGEHSCGMPDGCGGICVSCTGGLTCLDGGVCAPVCDSDDECVGDAQCTTEATSARRATIARRDSSVRPIAECAARLAGSRSPGDETAGESPAFR